MAAKKADGTSVVERLWKPVFEQIDSGRLRRGKALFRQGQVTAVTVTKRGWIDATLKGGNYASSGWVHVRVPTVDWWERYQVDVALWLSRRPDWLGKLFAAQWDPELLEFIASTGLSLFPDRPRAERIRQECTCTCGDWMMPCPHVVATLYYMVADIARDAIRAFEYVGLNRRALLDAVHEHSARFFHQEQNGIVQNQPLREPESPSEATSLWIEEQQTYARGVNHQEESPSPNQFSPRVHNAKLEVWANMLNYPTVD
jgi:uncharacterized Zn finger protein